MKYKLILIGFVACIVLEFGVYTVNHRLHLFTPFFQRADLGSSEKHVLGTGFTSPLLECVGVEETESTTQLNVSKDKLEDLVDMLKTKHKLETMSVYVRDLNNGPWIGINQDEKFIGGSLLKVPILISYLKLAEADPDLLQKEISYEKEEVSNNQYYESSKQLVPGTKYTIHQLLEYMIDYSDNNAANILSQNIDHAEFNEIFKALGFGEPDPNIPFPVDAKTYASFFRILYNASYLNKNSSEKALEILSKVEFNRGIQDLIPKNIVVSHKFGIRSDAGINQLHDCGIVYYPGHPYLLCVMSRGGTFDNMASSIAEVSKFIYDEVTKNY